MVRLLVAPAGHGKTAYAVERIRALPPLAAVRVLVPDHLKVVAFHRRLARAGGALGVTVQTFYDLYGDVLALHSGPETDGLTRMPLPVRHRLIRHLVSWLCDAGRLPHYAPLRAAPGFGRLLGLLFEELKRARVFPEDLVATTEDSEPRLAELAQLYAAYQTWLIENGWMDDEGQGWLAAIALEQDPALLSDLSLLVVDGFDEFNPTQLAVLRLLAGRATETLITLGGELSRPDRMAHRRVNRARAALVEALGVDPTPLPERKPRVAPPLAYLEARLFEPDVPSISAGGAIAFLEAQNRAAEAREALRWLKARVVRDGAPSLLGRRHSDGAPSLLGRRHSDGAPSEWRLSRDDGVPLSDVAVVARDVLPYRPFLEEAAAEFGMPLRFAAGAELRANPAVAALLNLLALPLESVDWSPRALLDALASPYLDWAGCDPQSDDTSIQLVESHAARRSAVETGVRAGRLLALARTGQVISGLDQWREAFRRLVVMERDDVPSRDDDGEEVKPSRPPVGAEAARLEAFFEEVVARIMPPPQATLREWVAWIEALIGEDPAMEDGAFVDGRRTDAAPSEWRLSRLDGAPSEWRLPRSDGAASLHIVACARESPATAERDVAALRAIKDVLRGLVLASEVLSRDPDAPVSHAEFVADLSQAVEDATFTLPVESEAILVASALEARGLTFDSVALLGLAEGDFPRAEREDALVRESDRAWMAGQGFSIQPRLQGDEVAFFYQAVTRARRRLLFCRPYLAEDGQPWEPSPYWSAVRALVEDAPLRHVRPTDPVGEPASEQELRSASPDAGLHVPVQILRARSRGTPSPWTGDLATLQESLAERFGPDRPWSSSRLETYAKCPFYFWAAYAMELEPRELPEPGFDVLTLGSIYHLVLERLYNRVPDGDPERLRAGLPGVAREVYDAAPRDYAFRPTRLWERQREEMTEVLERTLDALIEDAGEYTPLAQELPFGLRDRPAISLPGGQEGAGALLLRGYIDRVDRSPDGRLRVIDYKAGSTPISSRELDEGTRLQISLYALAAEQALGAEVASGFYWHISSARPSYLKLEKCEDGVAGAIETAVEFALAFSADVRAGRFTPSPPDGGCPSFCPAVAFCEAYRPRMW